MSFSILARLLPLLLFFLFGVPAMAADIMVVQSAPLKIFEQFQQAFLAELGSETSPSGPKQILSSEAKVVYLSDFADPQTAHTAINRFAPHLILALGQKAFEHSVRTENTPLLYALVAEPGKIPSMRSDITGISLNVSAGRQLQLFASAFSFKKLGIVYSVKHGAAFVKLARNAATEPGIEIVSASIDHVKEAPGVIKSMEDKIDALWLIPDTTVLTPSTMEYLAFFSLKNRIPIFSFSEKLLQYGATAAISYDIRDLGRQAALMARRIMAGTPVSSLKVEEPARIELKINRAVMDNLGISLKDSFRQMVYEENQ